MGYIELMLKWWQNLLIVAFFGVLSMGPTLKCGFIWDDHVIIENNPFVQKINVENLLHTFRHDVFNGYGDAYYRPLFTLSVMADYALWGNHPLGFHATTLLFHILTAFLLFLLIKKLFNSATMALLSAVLFAINPIITEQLIVVNGRMEIMVTFFILLTVLLAVSQRRLWQWMSYLSFVLACLSKENGVSAPLLLLLIGWFRPDLRISWKRYIPYFLLAAGYFLLRNSAVGSAHLMPSRTDELMFYVSEFPAVILRYIRILIFPFDLHTHRRMIFPEFWRILAPASCLVLLTLLWKFKSRAGMFLVGLFLFGLAPKLPILSTNALMLDHWAYLSGAAIYIAIAYGCVKISEQKGEMPIAVIILIISFTAFWIGMSHWNIQNRGSDKALFTWAVRYPSSSIVRANLGRIYYFEGDFEKAKHYYSESLRMDPHSANTANGLALTVWRLGDQKSALSILSNWIEREPDFVGSYVNRALILRGDLGLADLKHALSVRPDYKPALQLQSELLNEKPGINRSELKKLRP